MVNQKGYLAADSEANLMWAFVFLLEKQKIR